MNNSGYVQMLHKMVDKCTMDGSVEMMRTLLLCLLEGALYGP